MPGNVSDRLRDALEALDQAIDRLEAKVAERLEDNSERRSDPVIAERLDRLIQRIETALAD